MVLRDSTENEIADKFLRDATAVVLNIIVEDNTFDVLSNESNPCLTPFL